MKKAFLPFTVRVEDIVADFTLGEFSRLVLGAAAATASGGCGLAAEGVQDLGTLLCARNHRKST